MKVSDVKTKLGGAERLYVAPALERFDISVESGFAQTGLDWHEGGAGSYEDYINDNGSY